MLSAPSAIEHFFKDIPEIVPDVRKTFAKMYGLENTDLETEEVVQVLPISSSLSTTLGRHNQPAKLRLKTTT